MQKQFIVIIALISCYTGFTQQMGYHPVFIDQCTGKSRSEYISVISADETYHTDNTKSDTLAIPKPGIYFAYIFLSESQPYKIEIVQNEVMHDTLYMEKLTLAVYVSNPPFSEYFDCGKMAEGSVTDYYFNGNIRQEGTFKNGQLVGTLKKYYPTGEIQEIFYNSKKKWEITQYYQNGKMMSYRGNLHGYKTYEYYENGQLKTKTDLKGTFSYSEDGMLIEKHKP
jgi:hypothetical protein